MTIGPFESQGILHFAGDGGRSYGYAHAAGGGWCSAPIPYDDSPHLSLRDAITKIKQEKVVGYAAIGRLMTLAGGNQVDAEQALRRADQETIERARSVFMRDAPVMFFAPAPERFKASEFSPEQRRVIHMRQQDAEAWRRGGNR